VGQGWDSWKSCGLSGEKELRLFIFSSREGGISSAHH
jgi:hypothetical protein